MTDNSSHHLDLPSRPRRNRRTAAIRGLVRETTLHPSQLIYPLFVQDGATEAIDSMPGQNRWSLDGLVGEGGANQFQLEQQVHSRWLDPMLLER